MPRAGAGPASSSSSYTTPPAATTATDSWTKRLLQELKAQSRSPLPACILFLRPVSDAQLDRWEAVLRGVEGTGYECMFFFCFPFFSVAFFCVCVCVREVFVRIFEFD